MVSPRAYSQSPVTPTACRWSFTETIPPTGRPRVSSPMLSVLVRRPAANDDLVYLDSLAVKGCGDWPARHGAGYRRQLCLKVNLDAFASQ